MYNRSDDFIGRTELTVVQLLDIAFNLMEKRTQVFALDRAEDFLPSSSQPPGLSDEERRAMRMAEKKKRDAAIVVRYDLSVPLVTKGMDGLGSIQLGMWYIWIRMCM
jgi:hypothetical protein